MGCHQSTRLSNFCVSCRHLSVPTTLQCQDNTNGVLMEHPLCCLSTLISGVKARSAFGTPWWLQQHCDTHTWGVTLTCQVSRHVAPVVILAPTRGSLPILMSMVPYSVPHKESRKLIFEVFVNLVCHGTC